MNRRRLDFDDNAIMETGEQVAKAALEQTALLMFKPSAIHGLGGFARCDIASRTRVIGYVGQKINKAESLKRCEQNNEYIFTLNALEDIDGNVPWNPARLLNHSCAPNCDAEFQQGEIWIVARRLIRAGEEVTFNYEYDLEDYEQYPCNCQSANCVGFIVSEELFDHVRRKLDRL